MQNRRKALFSNVKFMLLGLTVIALMGSSAIVCSAQAKPAGKEAVVFPHMDAAMGYLKAASTELQQSEHVFSRHRDKAIQHVNAAIADVQRGMDAYTSTHPNAPRNETVPEKPSVEGKQFPHMEGALVLLQHAETNLNEAWRIYGGKRVGSLDETKAAIAEIQAGLKNHK